MFLSSPRARYLLLAASLLPMVYVPLFVLFVFSMMDTMQHTQQPDLGAFMGLFAVHALMMLINLANLVVYCIHAVKNTAFDDKLRIMWVLLIFFVPIVSHLVYWFVYLNPRSQTALTESQP